MFASERGIALISVLLLLTAMLVMALTMQLLALLGALSSRNQLAHAAAEAEQHSRLTWSLLALEQQLEPDGELPLSPHLPAGLSYSRQTGSLARLAIQSSSPPHLALEVLLELSGKRVRVLHY